MTRYRIFFTALAATLVPYIAYAHEVYVLNTETITRDVLAISPNPFSQIAHDPRLFILSGIIGVILVSTVFAMSITHWFEVTFNPYLNKLKPWAAPIARITLGVSLIASAYNNALFGPELPLSHFGSLGPFIQIALFVAGALCLIGILTRTAGAIALVIFVLSIVRYNIYMMTYANYLGEIVLTIFLGSGLLSLDHYLRLRPGFGGQVGWHTKRLHRLRRIVEPYAFPVLRILFGISIVFASFYAKFLHSQLALDVISNYHLTNFFPFEPLFVVLGACIVEILIGLFFIVGFEIRHTALFFLFWIFLSLLYFGESVWPHLVLVGVLLALFCHGYDRWSVEGYLFKSHAREPVL